MAQSFADKLARWQGARTNGEAAKLLGIPKVTFRKYLYGDRTPGELAMAELERRMAAAGNDGEKTKAPGEPVKTAQGSQRT